jgi:hypothetical protein
MTSTTLATIQDDFDSTDCTLFAVSLSPRHRDGDTQKTVCKTGCVTPRQRKGNHYEMYAEILSKIVERQVRGNRHRKITGP